MAKINGTEVRVFFGTPAAGTRVLYGTSCSINLSQNLYDVSNKDSAGWSEHGNGIRSWDGTIEGKYDTAGTGMTPDELMALIIARTADAELNFSTAGTASTATSGWKGNATFSNVTINGPMEDGVTWSASFKGNGVLAAI